MRQLSEGAFASPNTKIATLAQVSQLKIDFSVPETYATEIKKGMTVQFSLTGDDGRERTYNAKVYALESGINKETRTLNVRALYSNAEGDLMPGRYISVSINRQEIKDAISVPSEAIIPEMGKNIIYLYKGGQARPLEITTGLRTESRVQALTGLSAGDTLIISGVMQLRDGLNVVIDRLQ